MNNLPTRLDELGLVSAGQVSDDQLKLTVWLGPDHVTQVHWLESADRPGEILVWGESFHQLKAISPKALPLVSELAAFQEFLEEHFDHLNIGLWPSATSRNGNQPDAGSAFARPRLIHAQPSHVYHASDLSDAIVSSRNALKNLETLTQSVVPQKLSGSRLQLWIEPTAAPILAALSSSNGVAGESDARVPFVDWVDDVARLRGFRPVAKFANGSGALLWWWDTAHQTAYRLIQVKGQPIQCDGWRFYYLLGHGAPGETLARDVSSFLQYLLSTFPLRVHWRTTLLRDVPQPLALAWAKRKLASLAAGCEPLGKRINGAAFLRQQQDLLLFRQLRMLANDPNLERLLLLREQQAQAILKQQQESAHAETLTRALADACVSRASAGVCIFGVASKPSRVASRLEMEPALDAIANDLGETHRFWIEPVISGRKFQLAVAPLSNPFLALWTVSSGGLPSPAQIPAQWQILHDAIQSVAWVTPTRGPITVANLIREDQKLLGARTIQSLLRALPQNEAPADLNVLPGQLAWIGNRLDQGAVTNEKVRIPLAGLTFIGGRPGSGKSVAGRDCQEEALQQNVPILLIDPSNQGVGLRSLQNKPEFLARYSAFGIKQPQSYAIPYYCPALGIPVPPTFLADRVLSSGIVSVQHLPDREACELAADLLSRVLDSMQQGETQQVRLAVFLEELHQLLPRQVEKSARRAAERFEAQLNRLARTGRKYGIAIVVLSQSLRDLSYDLAKLRSFVTTRLFLATSDKDAEIAEEYIPNSARDLRRLTEGEAILYHAALGEVRLRIRPSYSLVFEPPAEVIRQWMATQGDFQACLSDLERLIVKTLEAHNVSTEPPLIESKLRGLLGNLRWETLGQTLRSLEAKGVIRREVLSLRGQPRAILLVKEPSKG